MTPEASAPPLPQPTRSRWEPLRVGLVELYRYDVEEFWFRDGHLLLRGNNGSGKSKVLALTLPFLLDANLSPSRVEPDGDRSKQMEWNLLMGSEYERRIGYSWIEFGRVDESGQQRTLTLGCGLRAVAGRSGTDPWYFITGQRIGADLWLTTPQRTALSRDRLEEAIGTHGHVFNTAQDYKRAVDERLFRLGEDRYAALVNTLIQLRQPQLSKMPDEGRLSNALSESLTPLDRGALQDVADAMGQLEELRRELEEIQAMRKAVGAFGERYRRYAQVATRRRARTLRQAQTVFDDYSREFNAAEVALEKALLEVASWRSAVQQMDEQLAADAERVSVLETHPTMQDARRIEDARRREDDFRTNVAQAEGRFMTARARLAGELEGLEVRSRDTENTRSRLTEIQLTAAALAEFCGIASMHAQALGTVILPDGVADAGVDFAERLRHQARQAETNRREQIRVVRKLIRDLSEADQARASAKSERTLRAEALEFAIFTSEQALAALQDTGTRLVRNWRTYLGGLKVLQLPDADEVLGQLELWVETGAGPNPARLALGRQWQAHESRLATREAFLESSQRQLHLEREELDAERLRLESGEVRTPPVPHTRTTQQRIGRPGAPLWQLVDFRPGLAESVRAGLEAALEASGILDAWLTPDAGVLDSNTHDVLLVSREQQSESLAQWLEPADTQDETSSLPGRHVVKAVLGSIACSQQESATAEAWVSPTGEFRLGPARGSWSKSEAHYIGHAAREAARRARLEELAVRLADIGEKLAECASSAAQLRESRARTSREQEEAPVDEPLLKAQAEREATERARRQAQAGLGEADSKLVAAENVHSRARDALDLDARSLRLPQEPPAIDEIEERLAVYRTEAGDLANSIRDHQRMLEELARQTRRAAQAQEDLDAATSEHLEKRLLLREAEETVNVLRESVGKAVEELLADLRRAKDARDEHTKASRHAQAQLIVASGNRGTAETLCNNLRKQLEERTKLRRQSVDELQTFAKLTNLLNIAVPEITVPDTGTPWGIEAALGIARRAEQVLVGVAAEEPDWTRVQSAISRDLSELQTAMSAQGHAANAEFSEYGVIVNIVYGHRPERPDVLEQRLGADIEERRLTLSAKERLVLEGHLEKEIAANLQRMIVETEERVRLINAELAKRPTSTGMRYRLDWKPLPEDVDGGVVGLLQARERLLKTNPDAWSPDDRHQVGEFLQGQIAAERLRDDQATLAESLSRALDYRRWHRFQVQRQRDRQDGKWTRLSGPASSGERALGLTVPLFAAASSHYESAHADAPRLVLLDEVFAGIDDEARANCMALIREFDLDFVMTSEREWGCYPQLPGLSICQLTRREGMDAVLVTRWTWDGRERREQKDPARRFPSPNGTAADEFDLDDTGLDGQSIGAPGPDRPGLFD